MINMKAFYTLLIFLISVSLIQSKELKDKLIWAADAEGNAPYIFQDPSSPDKLIGFEKDFAEALAKEMGLKAKFFQNQWDGLIPGLYRDDYHIAINGLEVTEQRKEKVLFSKPYYYTSEQIVVRKNTEEYQNLKDLEGKKVGCLKFSLAENILEDHGNIEIRSYEGEANAFADLKNERLDAVLVDEPIAIYQASWNASFKLTGQPIGKVVYAAALRLEDTLLLKKVNFAIESLIKTQKLKDILCEWNLWNSLTAEEVHDYSDCDVYASKYQEFVSTQKEEMNFISMIERYMGFLPELGSAALMTLELSVLSMILAIVIGLFVVITKVYAPQPFSSMANMYIEFVRGTPLLIQLYLIFYGLPNIGIKLDPMIAAIVTLAINYSAYEAENFRAGLNSVPKGQFEAAISLGMSRIQALRYIIIPQASRLVIPPVTNDFISLLKDSSLVSVITLVELTKKYLQLASAYYDFIGIGIIVALFYLILGLPFVKLSKYTENKLNIYVKNSYNIK